MENSRAKILEKIKQALITSVPVPFPEEGRHPIDFPNADIDLKQAFEQSFTSLQGEFYHCQSQETLPTLLSDILQHKGWEKIYCKEPQLMSVLQAQGIILHQDLASCDVSVTNCEALVSRTGSIVLSAAQPEGRTASVYAPAHLCIATTQQLHFDISDVLSFLQKKYNGNLPSFLTFASGPSRTADIEKTLVTGVHGPKEVGCILIG